MRQTLNLLFIQIEETDKKKVRFPLVSHTSLTTRSKAHVRKDTRLSRFSVLQATERWAVPGLRLLESNTTVPSSCVTALGFCPLLVMIPQRWGMQSSEGNAVAL